MTFNTKDPPKNFQGILGFVGEPCKVEFYLLRTTQETFERNDYGAEVSGAGDKGVS